MGESDAARQALELDVAPLRDGIEAVRRRMAYATAARRALLLAAAMSLLVIAFVIAGSLGPPPWPIRAALLILGATALCAGLSSIALPLLVPPSAAAAAARIERAFPELDDRLLSAVELAESPRPELYSVGLSRALIADARDAIAPLALIAAVDLSPVRRAARGFAVVGCVCAVLIVAFPHSLAAFFSAPTEAAQASAPSRAVTSPRGRAGEHPASPAIADLVLTLTPPSYSRLPSQTVTDLPREVAALVGTRAVLSGSVRGEAHLEIEAQGAPGESIAMAAGPEGRARAAFVVRRDATWRLMLAGIDEPAVSFAIRAIADAPPLVRIEEPGKDLSLPEARRIALRIFAADDFGLSRLALQHRVNDERQWHTQELAQPGSATASVGAALDLSSMGLEPGDTVAYRALATDNDAVSGPKQATSPTYVVRVARPSLGTSREQLERAERGQVQTLEELRDEVEQLGVELDRLAREADRPGAAPRQQTARLQDAAQRVEALTEKLDAAIGATMRQMALNELVTPEMMQKVGELQKLLQETLDEGLRASLERIQQALGAMDQKALREQLLEARDLQRRFMERLEQTIELLKGVYREQQLGLAAEMAERLVQRQEDLRRRTGELATTPPEKLGDAARRELQRQGEEQNAIARDAGDLERRLAQLAEEMAQADPEASKGLRDLSDTSEAQRAMREASERLREGEPSGALSPQTRALSSLRRLLAGLKQRQAAALGDARGTLPARLQQLAGDALYLSQEQEQLMERLRPIASRSQQEALARKRDVERVAREQEAVAGSMEELARGVRELSKQTRAVGPSLGERAATGAEQAQQAARDIRGMTPVRGLAGQREAMQALNETAADLLRLAQQAAGASQRMALEEYLKQLEALSQGQQALNEQTAQQLGETGPPMMPGPGALQQLGMEQELIRGALEKMLGQAQQDAQSSLGDQLGDVPGQMQDVESDLRQARAGRRTLQTQGDILRKMLDAQRSLYTKERRPERKAEQAKAYQVPNSPPKLEAARSVRPTGQEPMRPSEALPLDFEDLTRDYFRWLGGQQRTEGVRGR